MTKLSENLEQEAPQMLPGIYKKEERNGVVLWEIRMRDPGEQSYLRPAVMHTLAHFVSAYFRDVMADTVYYFGPNGCQTGFSLVTGAAVTERTVYIGMLGANAFINAAEEIPGVAGGLCGQPALHDLTGAKDEMKRFYQNVLSAAELDVFGDLLKMTGKG